MYIYGMSQQAWEFNWFVGLVCYMADVGLLNILSSGDKIIERSSKEERCYWAKKTEVEELKRIELDRQIYGKR